MDELFHDSYGLRQNALEDLVVEKKEPQHVILIPHDLNIPEVLAMGWPVRLFDGGDETDAPSEHQRSGERFKHN